MDANLSYSVRWTEAVSKFALRRLDELCFKPGDETLRGDVGLIEMKHREEADKRRPLLLGWKYCIDLITTQYEEGLLDHRIWLKTVLDTFKSASIEKTSFLMPLIAMYMGEFARSRTLMRQFLQTSVVKLIKLRPHRKEGSVVNAQYMALMTLVQEAFLTLPDCFVSVKLWPKFEELKDDFYQVFLIYLVSCTAICGHV